MPPRPDNRLSHLKNTLERLENHILPELIRTERPTKAQWMALHVCIEVVEVNLEIFLPGASTPPVSEASVADIFATHLDTILSCIAQLFGARGKFDDEAYLKFSQTLWNLCTIDNLRLSSRISENPFFYNAVFTSWTMRRRDGRIRDLDPTVKSGCPTLRILVAIIRDLGKRNEFLDHFMDRPRFISRFVSATIARVVDVLHPSFQGPDGTNCVGHLVQYIDFLTQLCGHAMLRGLLRRAGILPKFVGVLDQLSRRVVGIDESTRRGLANFVIPTRDLFALVKPDDQGRIVSFLTELCRGPFPALLTRFRMLSKSKMAHEETDEILGTLGQYLVYPEILSSIVEAFPEPERLLSAGKNDERFCRRWTAFWKGVRTYSMPLRLFKMKPLHICDNPECKSLGTRTPSASKECKGCSAVVYCSEACQEEDWKRYHRSECQDARSNLTSRIDSESVYHHHTRAFHVTIVAGFYDAGADTFEEERKVDQPHLPFCAVVPVLRFTGPTPVRRFEPLSDWEWDDEGYVSHPHLKRRWCDLVQDLRTRREPGMRLAVGRFAFGCYEIQLLVKLQLRGGQYVPQSSVYRFKLRAQQLEQAGNNDEGSTKFD